MAFPVLGSPKPQFFDSSGSPLASGTIEFRDPSTDSLIDTYPTADDADAATNANDNPLTLDSRGEPGSGLFAPDNETYKIILKDSAGSTIWTQDDIKTPLLAASGTFTGTLTGMSSTTQGTVTWVRSGRLVTLYTTAAVTGTSNSTAMTMTGLSSALTPSSLQFVPSIVRDNATNILGAAAIATDSVITFHAPGSALVTTGFTSSGAKGLPIGWAITYTLD